MRLPFILSIVLMVPASLSAQVVLPSQTGSITGIVRNTAGQPVSGVRVTAMPADDEGNRVRAISSLTVTDSTGRYTLENVPAGRYFLAAGNIDVPTFYPATLDRTKASAVSISSSSSLSPKVDFNITLQDASAGTAAPRGRLRGLQITPPNAFTPFPVLPAPNVPNPPNVAPFSAQGQRAQNRSSTILLNRLRLTLQPGAAWWTNASLVRQLGITEDQKKKIEAIFENYRTTLIQNKADLEKEESTLAKMLESDPLESPKMISAQIDRVVLERGEMERTNSRMTLEMRQVLTRSQWVQLQSVLPTPIAVTSEPVRQRGQLRVTPPRPTAVPPPPQVQPR